MTAMFSSMGALIHLIEPSFCQIITLPKQPEIKQPIFVELIIAVVKLSSSKGDDSKSSLLKPMCFSIPRNNKEIIGIKILSFLTNCKIKKKIVLINLI